MNLTRVQKRSNRRRRIRARVIGTAEKPRLSVFRSNKYIYAQLIDDSIGKTIASFREDDKLKKKAGNSVEAAKLVGESLAKSAIEKGVKKAVFDRGGYLYTGRIKALADGARSAGLEF